MTDPGPHLIVGLGNPGSEYARTRHNAGYRVLDVLLERFGARLKASRFRAHVAEVRDGDDRIVLLRSATYMNDSGEAVAPAARFYRVPPERVVVVHDEIDLPFGVIRVKSGGGAAGHNGVRSVASLLGTKDFARVRLGVGRPPGRQDPVAWVLRPFAKAEEPEVSVMVEEGADAALAVVRDGVAEAQNRFNGPRP